MPHIQTKKRGIECTRRYRGPGKPMHKARTNDPRPLLDVSARSHTLVHFKIYQISITRIRANSTLKLDTHEFYSTGYVVSNIIFFIRTFLFKKKISPFLKTPLFIFLQVHSYSHSFHKSKIPLKHIFTKFAVV